MIETDKKQIHLLIDPNTYKLIKQADIKNVSAWIEGLIIVALNNNILWYMCMDCLTEWKALEDQNFCIRCGKRNVVKKSD